jgi:hypothetical protein
MLTFFMPRPPKSPGEDTSSGFTAGSGIAGAGEADRRIDGEEPKEDRRLRETGGGSMGRGAVIGVPGVDGPGDEMAMELDVEDWFRLPRSGGAGLLDEMRRDGRSILWNLPWDESVNCPSFVLSV